MSPARELTTIRSFVRGQLRDEKDLSLLTLGLLKRRYLALAGGECLSPSAKGLLKQVVEEELIKMQDVTKSGSESETKEDTPNKRKREREKHSASESECEVESKQKKSRGYVNSTPESEDKEDSSEESVASEEEEEEETKTRAGDAVQEITNAERQEDSEDEEVVAELKSNTPKTKTDHSEEDEDESDSDQSDTQNASDGSKKEGKVLAEKDTNQTDSDSSSLPSLDDDQEIERQKKQVKSKEDKDQDVRKKTSRKREENGGEKSQKDNHKAVVRLKRYISLCGERRNYKKLLGDCRSVRSMVAVLKKELEDLGVHGQPSIEKCKKLRRKKDEAKELAELDVNNIIETQGRPKRRGAVARHGQCDPAPSTYQRSLNSGSGSDQENDIQRGRRKTDWANLQGIISDDADSD
ncbi:HIRA-interacting protein 3 isoform X2 [Entelurus aequoreus]|uniref:HIRA-interacting protein 3 isoform X2 n=1 Tax=Entelurus aequoreus TaxID=161455 RepID=UPI002B1E2000|nr:HIRA-interacting protein 3 isoform X2 [Entelurus aequoreus]